MQQLWAGWRAAYIAQTISPTPDEPCLFCELPEGDDEESLVLARGQAAYAVLNRFPYSTGHVMVAPYRHVADLSDPDPVEREEMWGLLARLEEALRSAMHAEGFNVGINLGRPAGAGVPGHFHIHLVPRWTGDTNFMTSAASIRVLPESLPETWDRVRRAIPTEDLD